MNAWDVSRIKDFSRLFDPNRDLPYERNRNTSNVSNFNESLNCWDTSSAETMFGMFAFATAFDRKISRWNLSSVTNTSDMFYSATAFNQNISMWNVSNVQSMQYMFYNATSFNQNLCAWGETFIRAKVDVTVNKMFAYSGCTETEDGTLEVSGCNETDTSFSPDCEVGSSQSSWCQVCPTPSDTDTR